MGRDNRIRVLENIFPEIGRNEVEKCRDAFIKLFLPDYDSEGIPAFKGLREAYTTLTGDIDFRIGKSHFYPGRCSAGLRSCMDFNSSSFNYALQNALNMYISRAYRDFPYHEEIFISQKERVESLRDVHSVQLGYYDELPDIDPEAGDYQPMSRFEDTEKQYGMNQKGSLIKISRKVIINDNVNLIKAIVERMARAARLAHSRFVWSFYLNNSNCLDGTAWFTAGHGNLGSSALDFNPLVTAITALANMTMPGPLTLKLGLDLPSFNWHLVLPIDLWDTATAKNQAQYTDASNTPNPCYKLFGNENERIIVCPFETDTNNWGIIRDPGDVPIVEMSYLNGKEDPEFIILDEGTRSEMAFISDDYGYKLRHEYGGSLIGYRGGYKAVL